jgi:hypothetical protein
MLEKIPGCHLISVKTLVYPADGGRLQLCQQDHLWDADVEQRSEIRLYDG